MEFIKKQTYYGERTNRWFYHSLDKLQPTNSSAKGWETTMISPIFFINSHPHSLAYHSNEYSLEQDKVSFTFQTGLYSNDHIVLGYNGLEGQDGALNGDIPLSPPSVLKIPPTLLPPKYLRKFWAKKKITLQPFAFPNPKPQKILEKRKKFQKK